MHVLLSNFKQAADNLTEDARKHRIPSRFLLDAFNHRTLYFEEMIVPKTSTKRQHNREPWMTDFIDLRLNAADKDAFRAWMENTFEDLLFKQADVVSSGWKMSLSWDMQNVCFISSATCRDETSVNFGVTVTSRSEDAFEATCLTVYKLSVLFPEQDLRKAGSSNNWG